MAQKPFQSRHSHKKRNKNNIFPVLRNVLKIVSLKNFIFINFHRRRCHNAMETFVQEYVVENSSVDFYRPIKIKLKTFFYTTKVAKVHVKYRIIPMKAQIKLFWRLVLIMQLKKCWPQRSFLLPSESTTFAANNDAGGLRKKNKVASLRMLEKGIESNISNLDEAVIIVDGIAVFKKY